MPKYQAMHEKVADTVKQYLLYRPMIKDETRNILFSARGISRDGTADSLTYIYEVTHLTCFLGGMFAMGGRIFDRPEDVEVGLRLADGCVWAYDVMPSGIMPEFSTILPCADMDDCPWNQTLWHDGIDPSKQWRAEEMIRYEGLLAQWEAERAEIEALEREAVPAAESPSEAGTKQVQPAAAAEAAAAAAPSAFGASVVVSKRDLDDAAVKQKAKALENDLSPNGKANSTAVPAAVSAPAAAVEPTAQKDSQQLPPVKKLRSKPKMPRTHEEYVEDQISRKHLLPGFVDLIDRRYILR